MHVWSPACNFLEEKVWMALVIPVSALSEIGTAYGRHPDLPIAA